jgi:hypothetical protein
MDNTVSGITFNADGSIASIAGTNTSALVVSHDPMTVGGVAATLSTALSALDQHTPAGVDYGPTDMIDIRGTDVSGNTIAPISLPAFDPLSGNPTTVGDLINAINGAVHGAVASLDASGNIALAATQSGQTSLSLKIADDPANTGGSTTAFSSFLQSVPGTDGDADMTFQINALSGIAAPQKAGCLSVPRTALRVSLRQEEIRLFPPQVRTDMPKAHCKARLSIRMESSPDSSPTARPRRLRRSLWQRSAIPAVCRTSVATISLTTEHRGFPL